MSSDGGVVFRRNRLPQWRLDGGVYFVTFCLAERNRKLSPEERTLVADCIRHHKDQRYRLSTFVVMDDHVHLLVQTMPGEDLSSILKTLKGCSARMVNRLRCTSGALWQKSNYTELLGNWAAIASRREYIYSNPTRRWEIEPHTYRWLEWFE